MSNFPRNIFIFVLGYLQTRISVSIILKHHLVGNHHNFASEIGNRISPLESNQSSLSNRDSMLTTALRRSDD